MRDDVLVILAHGVTGNKDRPLLVALGKELAAKGWPCLRISYSGNGKSEGCFTESTITKEVSDLSAVLSCVRDNVQIVYAGHSMGAAAGVLTAVKDARINILISLAGMVFTRDFAQREFSNVIPDEGCMWDEASCPLSRKFMDDMAAVDDVMEEAACVEPPWLLIHGTEDDVVPISDGMAAYKAATCKKSWVSIEGAGHMFNEQSFLAIAEAMDGWIKRHLSSL